VKIVSLADEYSFSDKDGERLSPRVRELLLMIEDKIRNTQEASIGKDILVSELQAYKRELESVTYCMKNGWTK